MNQKWNGEAAILIIKEVNLKITNITKNFLFNFIEIEENTSRADEMDWIIKYFILISVIFFLSVLKLFIIEQNDRVFISNIIQINSQEFTNIHKIGEMIRTVRRNGR
jgi:hypothetical protein